MTGQQQRKSPAAVAVGGLVTAALLALIVRFEGERLMPYRDVVGLWTVCSGHTGPDVVPGKAWTREQCDAVTREDATRAAVGLLSCTYAPLNRNQFDALVSWTYNVGVYRACGSRLVRALNVGDYATAATELNRWVYAGGKRWPGLVSRRAAEAALFVTPTLVTIEFPRAPAASVMTISPTIDGLEDA